MTGGALNRAEMALVRIGFSGLFSFGGHCGQIAMTLRAVGIDFRLSVAHLAGRMARGAVKPELAVLSGKMIGMAALRIGRNNV